MISKLGFYKKMPKARRIGGLVIGLVALAALCFIPAAALAETSADEQIILTWSQDPTASQTVTWLSPDSDANLIQYVEEPEYDADFSAATQLTASGQAFANCGQYRFSIVLRNLDPAARYYYRVGSDEAWSGVKVFRTAGDEEDFTFLYLGDVQEGYADWGDMTAGIYAENPQIRFALLGGDLTTSGLDCAEWSEFLTAATGVFSRIPMMPAKGNHDKELFCDFLALPDNGPAGLQEIFYSFDYGDAHFTVLDTSNVITTEVKQWLQNDLQNTDQKWKFAIFHHPPYQNFDDDKTVDDALREHWAPIFEDNQVDMVLVGHQHVYMRTHPLYQGEIMNNAYGIVYVMGNSGSKEYSLGPGFPYIAAQQAGNSYQVIELTGDVLTLTSRAGDGSLIEIYVLDKAAMQGGDEEPLTLVLSKIIAVPGDTVTASGRTSPDAWVPLKIIDREGSILLFDAAKADAGGNYSMDFIIPGAASGTLTVIAGQESDIAVQDINVIGEISLTLNKTVASIGDSIIAAGKTAPGTWIPLKIVDRAGNIVLFDVRRADAAGDYEIDFVIPDGAIGILTVIAGQGTNVAAEEINIIDAITLLLSKKAVIAGDIVTASGKTSPAAWVPIKVLDEDSNIILFDTGKADAQGYYEIDFVIPDKVSGTLMVIVGEGSCVARQDLAAGEKISLALDKTAVFAGESITAAGRTAPNTWVPIKAVDQAGNIVVFETGITDEAGDYSLEFIIPQGVSGTLIVTAGEGLHVATQNIFVKADISLSFSKTTAFPGDRVTVEVGTLPNAWVPVKVVDEAGNIVFFDAGRADAEGNCSIDFIIPQEAAGILTITAGEGPDVISGQITVEALIDECFIATAAFGSKYNWPVALLRDFRDHYLLTNAIGAAVVDFYYKHSPAIAGIIASSAGLKAAVRVLLAPIVAAVYLMYHPVAMMIVLLLLAGAVIYRTRRVGLN